MIFDAPYFIAIFYYNLKKYNSNMYLFLYPLFQTKIPKA